AQARVAFLGLAALLPPICLLRSDRGRGRLYHRQPDYRCAHSSGHRQYLDPATDRLVPRPADHFRRLDLCPAQNPGADQSHLQRHRGWRLCGHPRGARGGCREGVLMDRDASFEDAKRLYLESYGDPMVTNTYLKIALTLLALVCVALALIDLRTIRTFENFRP